MQIDKNFSKIEEFEKSLVKSKKHLNKSKPISDNLTEDTNKYSENVEENSGLKKEDVATDLYYDKIKNLDKNLTSDISINTEDNSNKISKVDIMFKDTENTLSKKNRDVDKVTKKQVAGDLLKASTMNPLSVVKAVSTISKYKKNKKKSKFKIITIIMALPLLTLSIYSVLTIYVLFFIDSSNLLNPSQLIQRRYSKLLKDGKIGMDIVQKFDTGTFEDITLPTVEDTEDKSDESDKSNLYLTVTTSSVPYYSQHDPRWKDNIYCPGETYSQSACGPTSLAMLLTYIKYTELDSDGDGITLPTDTAEYSLNNGYATTLGTASTLFYTLPNLTGEYLNPSSDLDRIKDLLSKGTPLIYSVNGSRTFAYSHLMVATGYKDGKWTVNDPNNYEFSNKTWNDTEFLSGAFYFVYIHK